MTQENQIQFRRLVKFGEVNYSGESGSDSEGNFWSQSIDQIMTFFDVDTGTNAITSPLFSQLEALIQSLREFSNRSSIRSTEENMTSERSRSSGQHSDFRPSLFLTVNQMKQLNKNM